MIYYVSTTGNDGTGDGSIGNPWATWEKLADVLVAGDTGYIRGGTYRSTKGAAATVVCRWDNLNGTAGNPIQIFAYPDEVPVFDFDDITQSAKSCYIVFLQNSNYVHIRGLKVLNLVQQPELDGTLAIGFNITGSSHNTIENCEAGNLSFRGFSLNSGSDYNLLLNCDAHHMADPHSNPDPYGGADGFGRTGGSTANHNTFRYCRAWCCCDDGWDHFSSNGYSYIEGCWAFWNGYLNEYKADPAGDGQGFKLGPGVTNQSAVTRIVKNCLSVQNRANGFDQNFLEGVGEFASHIYNNMSFDNGQWGFRFSLSSGGNADIFRNNISYRDSGGRYSGDAGDIQDHNSWNGGVSVNASDFVSLDVSQLLEARQADGSLPVITFGHLNSRSDLIDAGTYVGISYSGIAPDIGAFEYGLIPTPPTPPLPPPPPPIPKNENPVVEPDETEIIQGNLPSIRSECPEVITNPKSNTRIKFSNECNGIYLRWWYNGWHYWLFESGSISEVTEGEDYRTLGVQKLTIGSRQIDDTEIDAIRSIANTREVYVLTDFGWRTVRLEDGSIEVKNNMTKGYDVEIIIYIGSRWISETGFSPSIDIPVVPPSYEPCELLCIGNQVWMCLNYDSNYPGSRVYNNDEANRIPFGGLYTWNQVMASGFCPVGWHVPTLADWQELIDFIGDATDAGKLKRDDPDYWDAPNTGAANDHDFDMRSTGLWQYLYGFIQLGEKAQLWTADESGGLTAYTVIFQHNTASIILTTELKSVFAGVRLIRDALCNYFEAKYGLLYNYFVMEDARGLIASGWHIPTQTELATLQTYLGGSAVAGGKLKETGLTYWNTPNTGATNEVGFNGRGIGERTYSNGLFGNIKVHMNFWSATNHFAPPAKYIFRIENTTAASTIGGMYPNTGNAVRPIKDSTTLTHGQTGAYQGNDGKVYRTICIGTQEWLACNLAETKYRNGDPIPEVTLAADWIALATGALCAYDNDWDNV